MKALLQLDEKTKVLFEIQKNCLIYKEKIIPVIKDIAFHTSVTNCDAREIEKHGIVGATF